jgi:hypothetical protein
MQTEIHFSGQRGERYPERQILKGGEAMRKRKRHVVFWVAGLLLILMVAGFSRVEASECYQLFYNWNCVEDKSFSQTDIVLTWKSNLISKHKDGTIKFEGFPIPFAEWGVWGDSFYMDWFFGFFIDNNGTADPNCQPLFTGYKSMYGFFTCRDGATANKIPGCWLMMKLKVKDCPWINEK